MITDERLAALDAALETIGLPICPEWTYSAIRHCQRNMDLDVGDGFNEPDRQCGGSIAEIVNAYPDLRAHIDAQAATIARAIAIIEHCDVTEGVCCCGDDMATHAEPMSCGHSPVDHGSYIASQWLEEARAKLLNGMSKDEQAAAISADRVITASATVCPLCDGTGYKDHAGFAMDASNHEGVNLVALCLAMARIKELEAQIDTMWEAMGNLKPPKYSSVPHGELWEPGTGDPGSRAGLYKGFYDGVETCMKIIKP